jgi:dihydroorotase
MTEFIKVNLTPEQIAEREAWEAGAYERAYKEVKIQRQSAYEQESDPLMAKYLRDELSKEEWQSKVQEIKERFPYPEKEAE